ncbi:cell wall protein RBR3 isoform X1 [Phalaenopsis equestris]|uniref:cell wall protein RBR3 isoform X1 n=1 Tax=Phalaenopsis equestris TaxID=78828 RepID=UPI0009E654E0|nr:cell wall protein RBR3 isoform X1 [Phalaenopsis equestris]
MNSFTGSGSQRAASSSSSTTVSFDSYQFDFGIGSGSSSSSRPLKDQKLNPNAVPSNPLFTSSKPSAPSWTSSPATRPSWTHQPATASRSGLPNPAPLVGDIFGRSWTSSAASTSKLGIQDKNPNLFGDLVGSALGQGRSSQNVPIKSAPPKNSSFSMADLKSSIPKTSSPNPNSTGSYTFFNKSRPDIGSSMKSDHASNSKPDSFGSFTGFASKPSSSVPLSAAKSSVSGGGKGSFGSFQNVPTAQKPQQSSGSNDYSFGGFQNARTDDSGVPKTAGDGSDPFNVFFSPLSSSTTPVGVSLETQTIPEMHDWDVGLEIGGHDTAGTTTELEELPPPPVGVTASAAKMKGLDIYKQGQFADAIKWLSWALVLLEKSGNPASSNEVLTCRASCYKEVGEYKKAIADCSKVLDHDKTNVSVLLQRALLYESSEKYRLGAADLRAVLKIDPGNRLAKSTIHRLTQFAD